MQERQPKGHPIRRATQSVESCQPVTGSRGAIVGRAIRIVTFTAVALFLSVEILHSLGSLSN
jgi:hypothetical protein